MPYQTLTVTLNYDHSKKFAFLPPLQSRTKESILREAKNKFRSKALSSVYLQGGTLLEENENLPEHINKVWVGKGEPYCGPPAAQNLSGQGITRLIAGKSFVDEDAVRQLNYVASLKGVQLVVGMPDLHPGNRFPIGCAVAAEGIYPALIGSDVGCGIALYRLVGSTRSIGNPKRIANLLRGLDDPWTGDVAAWLSKYGIKRVSPFDSTTLGTVGSGNHFAEICTPDRIVDASVATALNVEEGSIYLLVHTGSRGLGASILARETSDNSNSYIPPGSPHMVEYLSEHDYAVKWAIANRDLVAYRIKKCLYPEITSLEGSSEDHLPAFENPEKFTDVTHNSVSRHALSIEGEIRDVWVHRKGAAPADQGIAPCPGSRGDFTWLLQPMGDGHYNAKSLPHGAGRRHARHALHSRTKVDKGKLTTTSLGSEVICTDPDLLIEEQPAAYKNIQCVIEDMEDYSIGKGVVVFRPVVTYKVREGAHE